MEDNFLNINKTFDKNISPTISVYILGFIFIISSCLFYGTLFSGFIFDDWGDLRNSYATPLQLLASFSPLDGDFRAVTMMVWRVSYLLFDLEPLYYHLLHLFIHLVIVLLIYFIFLKITKNNFISLFGSFLFSINKTVITPVSWISATIDQNLLFFVLIGIYLYLNLSESIADKKLYRILKIIFFTAIGWLALKSKLMAWTMPIVYLLIDINIIGNAHEIILGYSRQVKFTINLICLL